MVKVNMEQRNVSELFEDVCRYKWFKSNFRGNMELYMKIDECYAVCMTDSRAYGLDEDCIVYPVADNNIEITVRG